MRPRYFFIFIIFYFLRRSSFCFLILHWNHVLQYTSIITNALSLGEEVVYRARATKNNRYYNKGIKNIDRWRSEIDTRQYILVWNANKHKQTKFFRTEPFKKGYLRFVCSVFNVPSRTPRATMFIKIIVNTKRLYCVSIIFMCSKVFKYSLRFKSFAFRLKLLLIRKSMLKLQLRI